MRIFKKVYFKPIELTVELSDEEEQQIIEDLKKDGIDENNPNFNLIKEDDIEDILYDKFFKEEKNYIRKFGTYLKPDFESNIEEVQKREI